SNNVFFHKFILFLSHYAIYKITLRVISIDPKKKHKEKNHKNQTFNKSNISQKTHLRDLSLKIKMLRL
ncbi:hypothetical protein MZT58_27130, partial [Escherichia coli]|uniref:hypothetical protein n=1 Tax=Escherichia coli TaxID=562 RepID=UPI00345B3D51